MNSQFNKLFKGPAINQISIPTKIVSPVVLGTQSDAHIDFLKVMVVAVLVGGGLFIGYKILKEENRAKS